MDSSTRDGVSSAPRPSRKKTKPAVTFEDDVLRAMDQGAEAAARRSRQRTVSGATGRAAASGSPRKKRRRAEPAHHPSAAHRLQVGEVADSQDHPPDRPSGRIEASAGKIREIDLWGAVRKQGIAAPRVGWGQQKAARRARSGLMKAAGGARGVLGGGHISSPLAASAARAARIGAADAKAGAPEQPKSGPAAGTTRTALATRQASMTQFMRGN